MSSQAAGCGLLQEKEDTPTNENKWLKRRQVQPTNKDDWMKEGSNQPTVIYRELI